MRVVAGHLDYFILSTEERERGRAALAAATREVHQPRGASLAELEKVWCFHHHAVRQPWGGLPRQVVISSTPSSAGPTSGEWLMYFSRRCSAVGARVAGPQWSDGSTPTTIHVAISKNLYNSKANLTLSFLVVFYLFLIVFNHHAGLSAVDG